MADVDEVRQDSTNQRAAGQRVRRPGAGRKRLVDQDPTMVKDLEALVEPLTRGDPESPLRWTCKSTEKLAAALRGKGHKVSARTVATVLKDVLRYNLQANRKTHEGSQHPDRNAQFEYINAQAQAFQAAGQPVISVDTKKKELVGQYKNGGREWEPQGEAPQVSAYDFVDPAVGRAIPYGVYDVARNEGYVAVGIDHDTAAFAVDTIGQWWRSMGKPRYPQADHLLITADGGGSNGSRSRLWKSELQRLADATGLTVTVCHLPPGTSKWNKIEHRMFSYISMNWRSRPLTSHEIIVNLIGATDTTTGLRVKAKLNRKKYPTGTKVADEVMNALGINRHGFHGEWNYTITPNT
jgi:hypothetical protein